MGGQLKEIVETKSYPTGKFNSEDEEIMRDVNYYVVNEDGPNRKQRRMAAKQQRDCSMHRADKHIKNYIRQITSQFKYSKWLVARRQSNEKVQAEVTEVVTEGKAEATT